MVNYIFFAQATPGITGMLLPFVGMIAIFYFLIWRPQQAQVKEAEQFRASLAVGDKVITSGGIYGTITEVEKETVELEIASKVWVTVVKSQVVTRQKAAETSKDSSSKESK